MKTRTAERIGFLADLLIASIEHNGYGFPGVVEYKAPTDRPADTYAVIYNRYDVEEWDGEGTNPRAVTWRITIDTMAKGIGVLRKKYGTDAGPYMKELFEANRENDASITDVVGALAVLEAALFGDVVYG